MVRYTQHEPQNKWFFLLISLKVLYKSIEFDDFVLIEEKVVVLELPGEGKKLEMLGLAKDCKIGGLVETDIVV